jgi:hypothetical protein
MNLAATITLFAASDSASSTMPLHGHPETNYDRASQQDGPDKGGVAAERVNEKRKTKSKTLTTKTSGGSSDEPSSLIGNYQVVDGMGRVLHTCATKEDCEVRSAGNRYTKVVLNRDKSSAAEVRERINRTSVKPVKVFRRSEGYPNPYLTNPTSR